MKLITLIFIVMACVGILYLGHNVLYPPQFEEVYEEKTFIVGQQLIKPSGVIYNGYVNNTIILSELIRVGFSGETRYYKFNYKQDMDITLVDKSSQEISLRNVRIDESTGTMKCQLRKTVLMK